MGRGKWAQIRVEPGDCHLSDRALGRHLLNLPAGRARDHRVARPAYRRPPKARIRQKRALPPLRVGVAASMAKRQGVLRSVWKEIDWEAGKSQSAPRRGAWGAGRVQPRYLSTPGLRPPRAQSTVEGRAVSKKGQGAELSPALQAWVDKCLVPRLVEEYLGQAEREEEPCSGAKPVPEFAANGNVPSEVPR